MESYSENVPSYSRETLTTSPIVCVSSDFLLAASGPRLCRVSPMISIEYETFGDPRREPIILIPGLSCSMYVWTEKFISKLGSYGFFIIRVSNRDSGRSTKCTHIAAEGVAMKVIANVLMGINYVPPYTLDDMATDIVLLMDKLSINQCHIMGHSMGGMISQILTLHYPERVKSLHICCSTSGDRNLPWPRMKLFLSNTTTDLSSAEAYANSLIDYCALIANSPYFNKSKYKEILMLDYRRAKPYEEGIARQFLAITAAHGRSKQLRAIKCPALVIHGFRDLLIPPRHGFVTSKSIPNCEFLLIRSLGHSFPLDCFPDSVMDAVVRKVYNVSSQSFIKTKSFYFRSVALGSMPSYQFHNMNEFEKRESINIFTYFGHQNSAATEKAKLSHRDAIGRDSIRLRSDTLPPAVNSDTLPSISDFIRDSKLSINSLAKESRLRWQKASKYIRQVSGIRSSPAFLKSIEKNSGKKNHNNKASLGIDLNHYRGVYGKVVLSLRRDGYDIPNIEITKKSNTPLISGRSIVAPTVAEASVSSKTGDNDQKRSRKPRIRFSDVVTIAKKEAPTSPTAPTDTEHRHRNNSESIDDDLFMGSEEVARICDCDDDDHSECKRDESLESEEMMECLVRVQTHLDVSLMRKSSELFSNNKLKRKNTLSVIRSREAPLTNWELSVLKEDPSKEMQSLVMAAPRSRVQLVSLKHRNDIQLLSFKDVGESV